MTTDPPPVPVRSDPAYRDALHGGVRHVTHTTTRTYYWNHENVAELIREVNRLADEFAERAQWMSEEVALAGSERIGAVRFAVARLTDPVLEP